MRAILLVLAVSATSTPAHAQHAGTQSEAVESGVCIEIDETRDTLSPEERTAAILLLATQFDLAGRRIVAGGCATRYALSHIRLGENIFVTLTGDGQSRAGTAAGLDDLPLLYNQMVRAIVTGRAMSGFNVVDRTNVTAAQAAVNRVYSDRYAYARLGYGAIFGDRRYGTPSLGLGYRVELDSFGLDLSFLNLQPGGGSSESSGVVAASLLKLQALYFLEPTANASTYVGGGVSWGGMAFGGGSADQSGEMYRASWHGSGLQGELTVGYELPRASTLRIFVEVNGVLPFYKVTSETYSYSRSGSTTTVDDRYAPSVLVSVGIGWERSRGGYR